jgi:hypothetical protein
VSTERLAEWDCQWECEVTLVVENQEAGVQVVECKYLLGSLDRPIDAE